MEQIVIWRRMAEKWRAAAQEVHAPALKRCYVERAALYERLTAYEDRSDRRAPMQRRNGRGARS